jgi:hypothetical protein
MSSLTLTPEEEAKANAAASTVLAGVFRGLSKVCKGTGYVVEKSTAYTATGLRFVADNVEGAGKVSSDYLYEKSSSLNQKADEYSGATAEQLAAVISDAIKDEKNEGESSIARRRNPLVQTGADF